ncbi:MAG: transglycosylase SLT domain-containing protein [Leptospirales bacterium]|nr:transglycosylase SLT domain-containing protein [Leptospirales bacterium]
MNLRQSLRFAWDRLQIGMERQLPVVMRKRILLPLLILLGASLVQFRLLDHDDAGRERARIGAFIDATHPRGISAGDRSRLIDAILRESRQLQTPPYMRIDGRQVNAAYLLTAFIRVESVFDPKARSSSNALGYMQLKATTAAWVKGAPVSEAELLRGEHNIALGVRYLNILLPEMGDLRLATLAYNAGPNAVRRGVYEESYWIKVLSIYRQLQSGAFEDGSREL